MPAAERRMEIHPAEGQAKAKRADPCPARLAATQALRGPGRRKRSRGGRWQDWDLVWCEPDRKPIDPHDDWGRVEGTVWEIFKASGIDPGRRHTGLTLASPGSASFDGDVDAAACRVGVEADPTRKLVRCQRIVVPKRPGAGGMTLAPAAVVTEGREDGCGRAGSVCQARERLARYRPGTSIVAPAPAGERPRGYSWRWACQRPPGGGSRRSRTTA